MDHRTFTLDEDLSGLSPVVDAPPDTARFSLGREIGRGGMGRVVEALDRQFERSVAVKLLTDTSSAQARARFDTEAKVTGQLEHPAIPSVHERGVLPDGTPFYAMSLARGRTLAAALEEASTLEERLRLLPVLVQVAHALGFAHERGIIHRDVKPQNIIVGSYGRAFVLDWGIARRMGTRPVTGESAQESSPHQTQQGSVMGTPAYMAPEQARGDVGEIDARTDVFALGAILYHILSGRSPYGGDSAALALNAAAAARWEPLDAVAPEGLREICARAMAPDPARRYHSALEMAAALEQLQSAAVLRRGGDRTDRFATATIGAALVLLLLATAFVWINLPPLAGQGVIAFTYFATFVLGVVLSGVEWRTRGRYALDPVIGGMAVVTVLLGLAGTAVNLGVVLATLKLLDSQDPELFGPMLIRGIEESLGNLPGSAVFAALQLLLWGLCRRRAMRRP